MAYFKQRLIEKVFGHKYAIDAKRLGDDSLLAWSNLGYWQHQHHDYPQACQSLADQIAVSVQLKKDDKVLVGKVQVYCTGLNSINLNS
jgi:hypothetical protein